MSKPTSKISWLAGSRFAAVPLQVLTDSRLSAAELRVYIALISHADAHGRCYPTLDRLAELCGHYVSGAPDRAYMSRLVSSLEKKGYLLKSRPPGFNRVNNYQLTVPELAPSAVRTPTKRVSSPSVPSAASVLTTPLADDVFASVPVPDASGRVAYGFSSLSELSEAEDEESYEEEELPF